MSLCKLFLCLLILMYSCGSSQKSYSDKASTADTSSQQTKTKIDTLPVQPQPKAPNLNPGQAKVEGRIVAILPVNSSSIADLKLHIMNVMGYGRTTPPIASSDTLLIRFSSENQHFKNGVIITALIYHNLSPETSSTQIPDWSLVREEH